MVCEERFTRTRRTKYKLVPVGDDTTFHRQIRYVQMDRLSSQPISHLNTKWRWRIVVIGFFGEKTQGRFNEGVKTFLARKITSIAWHSCPVQCCYISRVVAGLAFHQS